MSNKNSISYRRVGDYLIPNLILPPEETSFTLGKGEIIRIILKGIKGYYLIRFLLKENYIYIFQRWKIRHGI